MRKTTILLTLAFALLVSGLALAHGHGHVMGTITAVSADRIELKTQDGKAVAVPLNKATQYFRGKEKAIRTDAHVGDRVSVHLGAEGAAVEVRLPAASGAPPHAAAHSAAMPELRKVEEPKKVCMVTNQLFEKDQIPVAVGGQTYYGCCEGCKQTLRNDPAARTAVDPVSGKKVDKAKAVIGAAPDGKVLYFENEANFKKYSASSRG
jgi:YHS domain-containing protein